MTGPTSTASATRASVLARPSTWSLRARLLAALVGLLAVVCLAVSTLSTLELQSTLVGRLDAQLTSAGGSAVAAVGPTRGGGPGGDRRGDRSGAGFLLGPGQRVGTLGARVVGGVVTDAGVLVRDPVVAVVPVAAPTALARVRPGAAPQTVEIPGRGDYRVFARAAPDGDVLLTGLPLDDVHEPVVKLVAVQAGLIGAALLAAGLAAALIVRRALRPLARVATLATHVTALPLERGEVDLDERVPAADTDPRTEVGQVGAALNRLLDHVGSALSARHASELRVRQFVADASHELRTPLAAIRGYAELTRRSHEPVPPDVAYALGRVESEAKRMTRPRRGPAAARPPGRRPAARPRPRRRHAAGRRRRQRRLTPPARTTAGAWTCPSSPSRSSATSRGCTRCWRTCWPTPAPTPRPAAP